MPTSRAVAATRGAVSPESSSIVKPARRRRASVDVASGRITLADRNTLRWDWSVTRLEGGEGRYDIRVSFPDDPNAYSMTIGEVVEEPDGRERVVPMVQADFQRVPEAPEAFRRLLRSPGE